MVSFGDTVANIMLVKVFLTFSWSIPSWTA